MKTRKVLAAILLCSWWFANLRVENGVKTEVLSIGATPAWALRPPRPPQEDTLHSEELITQWAENQRGHTELSCIRVLTLICLPTTARPASRLPGPVWLLLIWWFIQNKLGVEGGCEFSEAQLPKGRLYLGEVSHSRRVRFVDAVRKKIPPHGQGGFWPQGWTLELLTKTVLRI